MFSVLHEHVMGIACLNDCSCLNVGSKETNIVSFREEILFIIVFEFGQRRRQIFLGKLFLKRFFVDLKWGLLED